MQMPHSSTEKTKEPIQSHKRDGYIAYLLKLQQFTLASGQNINAQLHLCVYGVNSNQDWREKKVLVFHPPFGFSNKPADKPEGQVFTKGWGKHLIGPGKVLDTNKFIVICVDSLGGTTQEDGNSTTAREITSQLGYSAKLALEDTARLAAKLINRDLGISTVDTVVGISTGSMTAYKWLESSDVSIQKIMDICGGLRLSPLAREYYEIASKILDPNQNIGQQTNRLLSNLAKFRSKRINALASHICKGLRSLSATYDSDKALRYVRMYSLIYILTPKFFQNPDNFSNTEECIDFLESKARDYLDDHNVTSERLQMQSMLSNYLDARKLSETIKGSAVRIKVYATTEDLLFGAKTGKDDLQLLERLCPGMLKHRILKAHPIAPSTFTKKRL